MDPSWSILQVFVSNYWSQARGRDALILKSDFQTWDQMFCTKKYLNWAYKETFWCKRILLKKRNLENSFDFLEGFPHCLNPFPFLSHLWAFSCLLYCLVSLSATLKTWKSTCHTWKAFMLLNSYIHILQLWKYQ